MEVDAFYFILLPITFPGLKRIEFGVQTGFKGNFEIEKRESLQCGSQA